MQQQDWLLNMRLSDDVDQETFAKKHAELRDRLASLKLQLDVVDRSHEETAELAAKPFDDLAEGLVSEKVGATRRLLNFFGRHCPIGIQQFEERFWLQPPPNAAFRCHLW